MLATPGPPALGLKPPPKRFSTLQASRLHCRLYAAHAAMRMPPGRLCHDLVTMASADQTADGGRSLGRAERADLGRVHRMPRPDQAYTPVGVALRSCRNPCFDLVICIPPVAGAGHGSGASMIPTARRAAGGADNDALLLVTSGRWWWWARNLGYAAAGNHAAFTHRCTGGGRLEWGFFI